MLEISSKLYRVHEPYWVRLRSGRPFRVENLRRFQSFSWATSSRLQAGTCSAERMLCGAAACTAGSWRALSCSLVWRGLCTHEGLGWFAALAAGCWRKRPCFSTGQGPSVPNSFSHCFKDSLTAYMILFAWTWPWSPHRAPQSPAIRGVPPRLRCSWPRRFSGPRLRRIANSNALAPRRQRSPGLRRAGIREAPLSAVLTLQPRTGVVRARTAL